ncbi:protein FAR1-RELATED SEQUENCE 5-like [Helianthus annuus]|uniref:protein FAR1-RELATED SEQUENCE 5-like n=1 Tax=Helianthus annuus TaxID=4232 RepID=UPI000B8F3330|nr:protein FAR1-RELATED SEQUENCE 5-like [Helianthus annuus]
MASSDSSRVGVEPSASSDHHTTSSSYHPHHDASFCGPSNVNVNPISTVGPSDIYAVGPSDVDVNTLPAVNPTERTITAAIHATPNGTPYWIPQVDVRYLPVVNSTFTHWEDVVMMYNTYATQSGFSTRIDIYYVQEKENHESQNLTPMLHHPRNNIYEADSGCRARIKVRFDRATEQYKIYDFIAEHNHCMIGSDHTNVLKQNRKLGFEEQHFIHKVSLNKIGPTVAHNIQASLKDGPQNVRGTTEDLKNCSIDIRAFIGERDADILLHTMRSRVNNLNDFYFDCVIVGNELRSFFWADFVSLRNYEAFGDVCAFDATYDTNKCKMIFVPFIGVDHHKKCVIFGAGMLYDETIESYTWLLNTFLAAHKKKPIFVLTDQDASMK